MNSKEFIDELSSRLGYSEEETSTLVSDLCSVVTDELAKGNSVVIQNFGTFGVEKKVEQVLINSSTQQRMLIPPKLAVGFKPSVQFKDLFK